MRLGYLNLFLFVLVVTTISCSTSKKGQKENADVENFDQFYNRFHSDEKFQMSRIRFPIEGVNIDAIKLLPGIKTIGLCSRFASLM